MFFLISKKNDSCGEGIMPQFLELIRHIQNKIGGIELRQRCYILGIGRKGF